MIETTAAQENQESLHWACIVQVGTTQRDIH